ncbi:MAG: sigma-E processing peptidase SpoIIGA [Clostridia bacterium]|nr:sigma-E processing peptidase SpoIIGA [Clostridia bacterium]
MVREIYGDVLLLIDFCMNFFILHMSGILLRRKMKVGALLAASLIGGIYNVAKLFVRGNDIFDCVISLGVGVLMCYVAFGGYKFIKTVLVFFSIAALLGGCMFAVYYLFGRHYADFGSGLGGYAASHLPVWLFLVLAAVSFFISWLFSYIGRDAAEKREMLAVAENDHAKTEFRLLLDSGNFIKEPISGKYVVLLSQKKALSLLDAAAASAIRKKDAAYLLHHRFRLISAVGIDGRKHTYYGFRPQRFYFIEKHKKVELDVYIAVVDADIALGNFDGIAHPSLIA